MEAGTLTAAQEEACAGWLRTNSASPLEYAVAKARQHPVLVFGEVHEKKQALEFLNQLIPELHAQAGVRCVAMEVYLAEDNETIQKLVSAPHYDRELALRIARRQPWGVWGFKEYWDVLETVWRVNQTIPAGQKKMRLIGLDSTMDMRSVGIIGLEDNPAKHCPPWEKLRVLRLPRLMPKVVGRDVRRAAQIQREILDRDERAVVWVGAQHAWACSQAVTSGGLRATRMGAMRESNP